MPQSPAASVFVALDTADLAQALRWARATVPPLGGVKLGLEFFAACGPDGVRAIVRSGRPVFLDLKFHDIPNTVAGAVRAACALGPMMLNVHAAGGRAMMVAARQAAEDEAGAARPKIIAVTMLTSLDASDMASIGMAGSPAERVLRLAELAQRCGLDGVVCSAQEAPALRQSCGPEFLLVCPGLRPAGGAADDQKRAMTPAAALAAGADWLVIGRPITQAQDPAEAARALADEMATATASA
jgi:orotidine-5'-phosphate decarboxylase